jgi:hypothetical protein
MAVADFPSRSTSRNLQQAKRFSFGQVAGPGRLRAGGHFGRPYDAPRAGFRLCGMARCKAHTQHCQPCPACQPCIGWPLLELGSKSGLWPNCPGTPTMPRCTSGHSQELPGKAAKILPCHCNFRLHIEYPTRTPVGISCCWLECELAVID